MLHRIGLSSILAYCAVAGVIGGVSARGAEPLKVGDRAPDFSVTGIDGKQFSLSDKLKSGKHLVLIFSRAHW
ncbi:MAG: hypothetical protein D6753_12115 [Planctomycetota bacterium]|nr:MAG: hypothetical protein D6753_12115 [Planctomycetota bacterium]